jgi:hypothetical protein
MPPQLQPAQWIVTTWLPDTKFGTTSSDERLANVLSPTSLIAADMRYAVARRAARFDPRHDHTFTRGDVTTGWDHATQICHSKLATQAASQAVAAAAACAVRRRNLTG